MKYNSEVDKLKKQVEMLIDNELSASETKTIYKIINTHSPKVHYKVGTFMQKFSIVLKRILPDKVYEKLLMNHYKL